MISMPYVHFEDSHFVNFLTAKFIVALCVCDTKVTERAFSTSWVSNDWEDVDGKFNNLVAAVIAPIIDPHPYKHKVEWYILLISSCYL